MFFIYSVIPLDAAANTLIRPESHSAVVKISHAPSFIEGMLR